MYTVLVTGLAHTYYPNLSRLDGLVADGANLSEYFSEAETCNGAVSGGNLYFKVVDGELITHTEYQSTRRLTQAELLQLAQKTQGQWSDGFGEGFEQQPVFTDNSWQSEDGDSDVYVSPWCRNQVLKVQQTKA